MVQVFCKGCSKRLVVEEKHARLVELRVKPETGKAEPHTVWDAKILRCPDCGYQTLQRTHGSAPLAASYDPDFKEALMRLLDVPGDTVVYIKE